VVRAKLVEVAAELLSEHGPAAVTTRGVAEAAGVQPPTIYRLFGDKDGLLDAVAEHAAASFVAAKADIARTAAAEGVDPLEDLRTAWYSQVDFAVANPAVFQLLSDPARVLRSPAARAGRSVLAARVHRLAVAGRLRVEEARCVDLIYSAGTGVIQTLLGTPPEQRDPGLAGAMWEAVLGRVLDDAGGSGPEATDGGAATRVAFQALAHRLPALTGAERSLLVEWLARVDGP